MAGKDILKQACAALVEYGYNQEDDDENSYVRSKNGSPRDQWYVADGGFERYTRVDGAWEAVPYTINERFASASGLDHKVTPECFDYVYPADYVLNIYKVGNEERAKYLAEFEAKRAALLEEAAQE